MNPIDADKCRQEYEADGRRAEWLARFVRKHPAAFHLSWVQSEMGRLMALGDWDSVKALTPGRGESKSEPALKRAYADFLIFQAVTKLLNAGHPLAGNKAASRPGAFDMLSGTPFLGAYLSPARLRDRYYRFVNSEPALFNDNGRLVCGPTRADFTVDGQSINAFGFWTFDPS